MPSSTRETNRPIRPHHHLVNAARLPDNLPGINVEAVERRIFRTAANPDVAAADNGRVDAGIRAAIVDVIEAIVHRCQRAQPRQLSVAIGQRVLGRQRTQRGLVGKVAVPRRTQHFNRAAERRQPQRRVDVKKRLLIIF
jgi:hypothetical protein